MQDSKNNSINSNCDVDTEDQESLLMDHKRSRYPFCIVWTPIPVLTWFFPIIGHMGIAMSSGVVRDFAGPYYVSEDDMAFGRPTKYWQLFPEKVRNGRSGWDAGISAAAEVYKERMHNICCDNCHSFVACALNNMQYDGSTSWNMIKLCLIMTIRSKYVSFGHILKTWLPFLAIAGTLTSILVLLHAL